MRNISVRVDSPGDNGAVTRDQRRACRGLQCPIAAPPEVRYQEPDPQYPRPLWPQTGPRLAPPAPAAR